MFTAQLSVKGQGRRAHGGASVGDPWPRARCLGGVSPAPPVTASSRQETCSGVTRSPQGRQRPGPVCRRHVAQPRPNHAVTHTARDGGGRPVVTVNVGGAPCSDAGVAWRPTRHHVTMPFRDATVTVMASFPELPFGL